MNRKTGRSECFSFDPNAWGCEETFSNLCLVKKNISLSKRQSLHRESSRAVHVTPSRPKSYYEE